MAYFSTWRLHGNRVSKTRFISLINKNKLERNHQNIRENKKKQKGREDWDRRSELVALDHRAQPRQTQATRDPGLRLARLGRLRPRDPGLGLACLGRRGLGLARLGRRSLGLPGSSQPKSFSPSDLSLPLIWVFRIGIDVFGISWICFWVFQSVHETSNFF